MLFSILTTALLASTAFASAIPAAGISKRQTYIACQSGTPQCCATDVLGLADLDCFNPPSTPTSRDDFDAICSAQGQQAKCCALPILEQGLICSDPL